MDPTFGRDFYKFSKEHREARKKEERIWNGSSPVSVENERFCGLPCMEQGTLKLAFSISGTGCFGIVTEGDSKPEWGVFVDVCGKSNTLEKLAGEAWSHDGGSTIFCEVNFETRTMVVAVENTYSVSDSCLKIRLDSRNLHSSRWVLYRLPKRLCSHRFRFVFSTSRGNSITLKRVFTCWEDGYHLADPYRNFLSEGIRELKEKVLGLNERLEAMKTHLKEHEGGTGEDVDPRSDEVWEEVEENMKMLEGMVGRLAIEEGK